MITTVLLAQLNRGVEMRPDSEPQLSDLRDSGEIEQNADIVVMLHRSDEFGAVKLLVKKKLWGRYGVEIQREYRDAERDGRLTLLDITH
jgi:hypothetical protein